MLNFFRNLRRNVKSWESFIQAGQQALESNQYAKAKEAFGEALRKVEDDGQEESIAITLMWFASLYHRQHQYAEAVPHLKRALTIWEKIASGHNQHVVQVLTDLGQCYSAQEKFEEAIESLTRALATAETFEVANELNLANILKNLSWAHCAQGNCDTAESLCRRALSIQENLKEADSEGVVDTILMLIIYCRRQHRLQEIDLLLERLLELLRHADFDPAILAINISAAGQKLLHEHTRIRLSWHQQRLTVGSHFDWRRCKACMHPLRSNHRIPSQASWCARRRSRCIPDTFINRFSRRMSATRPVRAGAWIQ